MHPKVYFLTVPVLALCLTSCSSTQKPKAEAAATVGTASVFAAPPVTTASSAKAVWVLPQFATGYVQGRIDPATGDFVGGHSRETVVQEGHWASQEEAELRGHPYVLPGSNEIVDPRNRTAGPTVGHAGRMNVALNPLPQRRVDVTETKTVEVKEVSRPSKPSKPVEVVKVRREEKKPEPEPVKIVEKKKEEKVEKVAAEPKRSGSSSRKSIPLETKESKPAPKPAIAPAMPERGGFKIEHPNDKQIALSGGKVGESYNVPLANGKNVSVKYLTETQVVLDIDGKSNTVSLPHAGAKIKLNTN